MQQRERVGITRALLNADKLSAGLRAGRDAREAMSGVPVVGVSRALARVDGAWVANGSLLAPTELPARLIAVAPGLGQSQRFTVDDQPYLAVAVGLIDGVYVEVFPLTELADSLALTRNVLIGTAVVAAPIGGLIGFAAANRLLRPVQRMGRGAQRLASGDLEVRMAPEGDADLDPIIGSFNDMAEAVESRIRRERRFSANVSHELRSPLTAVVGTTEFLESRADTLPERERSLVHVLSAQVDRMSRMLLDLLEISRIGGSGDATQAEPVDLRAMCEQALADRGQQAVVSGEAMVVSDGRRIERIIRNIVDNAVAHAGGVVAIAIATDGTAATVAVDDAGPGIDDELADRLFEPFARGSGASAGSGAGLGLAIAREQATLIGATITTAASPQGGARFTVSIPIGLPEGESS